MINIVILLCFVLCTSAYDHVSDSNYTQVLQSALINTFILSNNIRQIEEEAKILQQFLSNHNQSVPIFVGKLGNNVQAQQDFNIKRYPYFGISLKYHQKASRIFYGLPDIVTQQTMSKLVAKVIRFVHQQRMQQFNVMLNEKQLQDIGIQKSYLVKHFYLSPIYYSLQFSYQNDQLFEGKSNLIIQNQQMQISNPEELKYRLLQLVLQSIPEFNEQIYTSLAQISQNPRIFFLILDSFHPHKRQSSLKLKQSLRTLTKEYFENQIYVFWIQSKFNIQKQEFLGFSQSDNPPLFALFDPSSKAKSFIPSKTQLNAQIVREFIEKYIDKEKAEELYERVKQKLQKRKIGYSLGNQNYLIIVSSRYNEGQIEKGEYIVRRINRFIFDKNIKLLVPRSYKYDNKQYKSGIFMQFEEKKCFISEHTQDCWTLKDKVGGCLGDMELPPNWCIMEDRMREHLLKGGDG